VDADTPTAARIYDYLLGGVHNFAVDREVARQAIEAMPDVAVQAKANRAFLHRAVRFLVSTGMRQFLDLGSGIPTVGNVHEIVARATPDGRVVYVDIDPVAVAHGQQLLAGDDHTVVVQHDLRDPRAVLADQELRRVLDLGQPVAVLAVAVLHAVSDQDDPAGIIARYRDALPAGSYLVIAHGTDEARPEQARRLVELSKRTPTPMTARSRGEIARLFDGCELVEPGLVWAPLWRPESPHQVPEHPEYSGNLVGVGRKR
jgi:hypothetical protein